MSADFLQALPNIGTAGIAIYVMWKLSLAFIERLKEKDAEFVEEVKERENAFRSLEKEVRENILDHLISHRAVNERVLETNKEVIELLADIRNENVSDNK